MAIGRGSIEHEAKRDDSIYQREAEQREAYARSCLTGTIDAVAVK